MECAPKLGQGRLAGPAAVAAVKQVVGVARQVLPDLWQAHVGRFSLQTNTMFHLFRFGDTLIDTGPPNQWHATKAFIADTTTARGGVPLRRVLVTHHHEDHAGNGRRLQDELDVPVAVPEISVPWVTKPLTQEYYRHVIWGKFEPFQPREILRAVEPLPELGPETSVHVVHAPGHIDDHHVFHVPNRGWLFTADLFVARRRVYYRKDENAAIELESLRKALQLDFDTLICAHRGVVTDGKRALADRVAFMEEIHDQVRTGRHRGLSSRAIRTRLLGREGLMRYLTLNDFSKLNFVNTIL